MLKYVFISILFLSACRNRSEVIHTFQKDSTIVRNEVIVDTLLIKKDSFSGDLPLALLQQLGEYTLRGDRTTTKIYYRDGRVGAITQSDSIMTLLLHKIQTLEQHSSSAAIKPVATEPKQDSQFLKSMRWLTLLALIIGLIIFTVKYPLKWKRNIK